MSDLLSLDWLTDDREDAVTEFVEPPGQFPGFLLRQIQRQPRGAFAIERQTGAPRGEAGDEGDGIGLRLLAQTGLPMDRVLWQKPLA